MKKEFKFYPESFGDLTVEVGHMDLDFDVFADHTVVKSDLRMVAKKDIDELDLNAKKLEVKKAELKDGKSSYEYLEEEDILRIKFDETVKKGEDLVIHTETVCKPTSNILEGLYYDETPEGAPPHQITQCQQWGFQRIVPCIDDMTAKCTYSTSITADQCYTNIISNGDLKSGPEDVGQGRVRVQYDNVVTPMATYLFFLGCGTYATFKREVEYPDGDKFMIEFLVPPNSDKEIAEKAIDVIHDAILWIYLFTGPGRYENWDTALKIKELIEKRETLKKDGGDLKKVRKKLKESLADRKWGYKYTGTVYREIGMQNSDFGGMENVGNTTITTNRIMPFPEMTDGSFEYMIAVKVHEFYHNLNGSEVTGRSPFEIWLNEAVTVFVEQWYGSFLFGEDYERLDTVLRFLYPGGGTFAQDDNAAAMPIEPDGFNDPNELITGVTYVKAPEFVRMIETLMSKDKFVKGLDLYHTKYKHSNASRAQWVEAMEEASGLDFQRMAQVWLKQSSYPKIHVETNYDESARKCTVTIEQKGFKEGMHWEFPFLMALCDENGGDIEERLVHVKEVETTVVFEDVDKPAFYSFNRKYSVFGKVFFDTTDDALYLQLQKDPDAVNKYMAFYALAEKEKLKLLEEPKAEVGERFRDCYFEMLNDNDLMASVSTGMLGIFESSENERFSHEYQNLYDAVKKLRIAVAKKYQEELYDIYERYLKMEFEGSYVERMSKSIKARQVKNLALRLLSELDDRRVHKLIKKQFEEAECATDKVSAFSMYINSSAADKMDVLKSYQKVAEKNLVSWESFLSCIARNDSDDALDIIRAVEESNSFRIDQANDQRALYAGFAGNRKKSLLTEEGRKFLEEKISKLADINEYNTLHVLKVFGFIDKIAAQHQVPLVGVLKSVLEKLDAKKTPSVVNTIQRILDGSPKGLKRWEEANA